MAALHKLKLADLKRTAPGFYGDGGNLWLQIRHGKTGTARSWIFRFKLPGKPERLMGIGSLDSVTLAKARVVAADYRDMLADGIDPIDHRNAERAKSAAAVAVPTFDEIAAAYIRTHRAGWRNPIHAKQWETTLATYASPTIGKLPVDRITTEHVLKALEPIWHDKTDTAKRVRGRIELVLTYATARKLRTGDNPARWRGHLDHLLPHPSRVAPVEHHAALDYRQVGAFMAELRQRDGIAALAMEWTVLTAARTAETLGATWPEIDGDVWIVPAHRIKAGKEHRVPLSKRALEILQTVRAISAAIGGTVAESEFIFANDRTGARLSSNALLAILKRMNRSDVTTHGFRSAFRDWISEKTQFDRDAAELALAHRVSDKVEAAYRRGDMFGKRRTMMQAWSDYCAKLPITDAANVVEMTARK